MHYPEQFDTTGPATLEDSYAHLSWVVVSVRRVLDEQGEIGWELLPDRLAQAWGDPDWYERPWLADFYNAVYYQAGGLEPGQVFVLDEIGEPVGELARLIDSVVQGWSSAAYQEADQEYPGHAGYDPAAGHDGYDPTAGYDGYDHATGYDQPHDPVGGEAQESDPGYLPEPVITPTAEAATGTAQEPETELDPAVAREVLARVVDDEEDDLSLADQKILATVLTVERFQYLAREFDLV